MIPLGSAPDNGQSPAESWRSLRLLPSNGRLSRCALGIRNRLRWQLNNLPEGAVSRAFLGLSALAFLRRLRMNGFMGRGGADGFASFSTGALCFGARAAGFALRRLALVWRRSRRGGIRGGITRRRAFCDDGSGARSEFRRGGNGVGRRRFWRWSCDRRRRRDGSRADNGLYGWGQTCSKTEKLGEEIGGSPERHGNGKAHGHKRRGKHGGFGSSWSPPHTQTA